MKHVETTHRFTYWWLIYANLLAFEISLDESMEMYWFAKYGTSSMHKKFNDLINRWDK